MVEGREERKSSSAKRVERQDILEEEEEEVKDTLYETVEVWAAEKKGGGNLSQEVDLREESREDQEEWKAADLSEWTKIKESGAIKVLSLEESRKVTKALQEEGKSNRILPSRMARRYKPAEQPKEPPSKKSRLCIRGDKDPDILELERFSPTVNTMNLNVMLQLAVNEGMEIGIGDLKSAFCQSSPLTREKEVFFRQPPEGISGMRPEHPRTDLPNHNRMLWVGGRTFALEENIGGRFEQARIPGQSPGPMHFQIV